MHLKSLFPEPAPTPDVNLHNVLLARPDQAQWKDFTLYADAKTHDRLTFRQFVETVYDAATALGTPVHQGGLGMRGGLDEIVGIISDNSLEYITLVHSLLALTVPFALLSSHATPFELAYTMAVTTPSRLFVQPHSLDLALKAAKDLRISRDKIYILGGRVKGFVSFDEMIDTARGGKIQRIGVRPAKKDTLAYLVLSSGTSGLPKAVMITHGNVVASISQAMIMGMAIMALRPPRQPKTPEGISVNLGFLPLHHSYGLHQYTFRNFMMPSTIVIQSKWDINVAIDAIEKYRVTSLNLIPSIFHQLVNNPRFQNADLSSIMSIGSGAAYLPQDLLQKMLDILPKDTDFAEGYGMSEATLGTIFRVPQGIFNGKLKVNPSATGILCPGIECRIIKEDGTGAAYNEPGELLFRGDTISSGYWNNTKANKEAFTADGWFRTGDMFTVNEDGMFFFADRAKDTLKISGQQVSPSELENVLLAHPDGLVIDVSVAGVQGHGRTSDEKVPRAWVVLSASGKKLGTEETVKSLERWSRENTSKYKWLRGGIEVVDEIPKTPTGKVLRRKLQEKYEKERAEKEMKAKL